MAKLLKKIKDWLHPEKEDSLKKDQDTVKKQELFLVDEDSQAVELNPEKVVNDEDEESYIADEKTYTEVPEETNVLTNSTFRIRLEEVLTAPPSLILLFGENLNQVGKQWFLKESGQVVGRNADAKIHISDSSMSRSHAKFDLIDGKVCVMDLKSFNGTYVNGEKLAPLEKRELKENDQIKMGKVILKFVEEGSIESYSAAQMNDSAMKDPLTQIYNRRGLEEEAHQKIQMAKAHKVPLSFLVFDIDFFKKINDEHGHAAGDSVLKELVHVVKSGVLREKDCLARYGGEEFCLLLLSADLEKAKEVGERVRSSVENHEFSFKDKTFSVTVSVGVATFKKGDKDWNSLFRRADKAVYLAKNSGRNCVKSEED